jgi:hypothetical protein
MLNCLLKVFEENETFYHLSCDLKLKYNNINKNLPMPMSIELKKLEIIAQEIYILFTFLSVCFVCLKFTECVYIR